MKIGMIVDEKGYGRFGDDKYKKLKEHGYDCADFDMSNTETPLYEADEADAVLMLQKEKQLAKDAGIEISQVHGPWVWPIREVTEEGRFERLYNMKKSIRYTALLGCKNWVVHPHMPFDIKDIGTGHEQMTYEKNIAFFRELLTVAKECDVTICLENMPFAEFSLATPDRILDIVKEIDDEHFMICLDTGHVAAFRELLVGDVVRKLGKHIKTFHIHDTMYDNDIHMMPYFGVIDWEDFITALKEINYKGVFSLETLPSRKLSTKIFDEMGASLANLAKEMTKGL